MDREIEPELRAVALADANPAMEILTLISATMSEVQSQGPQGQYLKPRDGSRDSEPVVCPCVLTRVDEKRKTGAEIRSRNFELQT